MQTTKRKMNTAETHVMQIAEAAAAEAATSGQAFSVKLHAGDAGHRAVQIYGCPISEAREHANAIADALTPSIRKGGYPAVRVDGGLALVWYR